jgi:FixJ family two-component response regulator
MFLGAPNAHRLRHGSRRRPDERQGQKGGAIDLPTKPIDRDELLAAVARAVAKDAADLNEEIRIAEIRQRVKMLTVRETQVFALVVTGMLNKQIAYDLGVGLKTIIVHRARLMEKMRAASVAELVRLADAVGVIVPSARQPSTSIR